MSYDSGRSAHSADDRLFYLSILYIIEFLNKFITIIQTFLTAFNLFIPLFLFT
jgi:hypothetical protein